MPMPKPVAVVLVQVLNDRVHKKLALDFLSKEYQLMVFHINMLAGINSMDGLPELCSDLGAEYRQIKSYSELGQFLIDLNPELIVDVCGWHSITRYVAWKSRNLNTFMVQIRDGTLPLYPFWGRLVLLTGRLLLAFSKLLSKTTLKARDADMIQRPRSARPVSFPGLAMNLLAKYLGPQYDLLLASGTASSRSGTRGSRSITHVAAPDLEAMMLSTVAPNQGYLLFIDEALSDSNDYALTGRETPISPQVYYPWLRDKLTHIASEFNLPLKIALHPDSSKNLTFFSELFSDTELISGSSVDMLKGSSCVVYHSSTLALLCASTGVPSISIIPPLNRFSSRRLVMKAFAVALGSISWNDNASDRSPQVSKFRTSAQSVWHSDRAVSLYLGNPNVSRAQILEGIRSKMGGV